MKEGPAFIRRLVSKQDEALSEQFPWKAVLRRRGEESDLF